MNPSLEEERRALLEQIAASREIYRRMLTDQQCRQISPAVRRYAGLKITHGSALAAWLLCYGWGQDVVWHAVLVQERGLHPCREKAH